MITFTSYLIALLISCGIFNNPSDVHNITSEQESQIMEIIIEDDIGI